MDQKVNKKPIMYFPKTFLEKVSKAYPEDRAMIELIRHSHGFMGGTLHRDSQINMTAKQMLDMIENDIPSLKAKLEDIVKKEVLYNEFRKYYDKHIQAIRHHDK